MDLIIMVLIWIDDKFKNNLIYAPNIWIYMVYNYRILQVLIWYHAEAAKNPATTSGFQDFISQGLAIQEENFGSDHQDWWLELPPISLVNGMMNALIL